MEHISVVIPCYNESPNINILYTNLMKVFSEALITGYNLIFIDDGSTDNTFELIKNLNQNNPNVKGISLSRNFGHQAALLAGIKAAEGEYIITMDADLQHPPELIPQLIKAAESGYDIVNTRRTYHEKTPFLKKWCSKKFYQLINKLSDVKIEPDSSDFRLMNRKSANEFIKLTERSRFTRGLVSWIGFRQTVLEYTAGRRHAGNTKYSIKKMAGLAIDGITSFSSRPLKLALLAGTVLFILGLLYALYAIWQHFHGQTVPGWTSLMVVVLITGGIQLLSIGFLGLYIANIFNEAKKRPVYIISETI